MSWPPFIDEIRRKYLADEGNVFLLFGPGVEAEHPLEGQALPLVTLLERFLATSRGLVGRVDADGLHFPSLLDRAAFDRTAAAAVALGRRTQASDLRRPPEALGRVWTVLQTRTVDQGWVITPTAALYPGHRKRIEDLGDQAPPVWEWANYLRSTNHIVLLIARDPAAVRLELLDACLTIAVPISAPAPAPAKVAAPAPAPEPPAPPPESTPEPPEPTEQRLGELIQIALQQEAPAGSVLPVVRAAARWLHEQRPDRFAGGEISVDPDGRLIADEAGAAALEAWRGDIALEASASRLLSALQDASPDGSGPALDPTALRVMRRRLARASL